LPFLHLIINAINMAYFLIIPIGSNRINAIFMAYVR
jgi:hypothetical protein